MSEDRPQWRIGHKVPINVYEGDRPVCQCHNEADAKLIVKSVNWILRELPTCERIVPLLFYLIKGQ
jgi:hypothetical protein